METNPWYQVLMNRPSPILLYTMGLAALSPGVFLAWKGIADRRIRWILLAAVYYTTLLVAVDGREYRYILPIVPLLAIAAGHVLATISSRWKMILTFLVIVQMGWTFYLTERFAWHNWGEIMIPF